jgi:hypothetical protein
MFMRITVIIGLMFLGETAWCEEADQIPTSVPVEIVRVPF